MDVRRLARFEILAPLIAALLAAGAFAGVRYHRPTAIFVFEQHPDLPFDDVASGKLGVIQPSWARAHLYAAYRSMESALFTPGEQQAYLNYLQGRLGRQPRSTGGPERWSELRGSLGFPSQASGGARALGMSSDFTYSLLCVDDAFELAAETLQARIDRFGADSAEVQEWLKGQDQVFAICSDRELQELPPPAPAGIDPLIRADRAYQTAAALFYTGRFDEARSAFRRIEQDSASPWRVWGPYMAGRSMLWKARFLEGRSDEYPAVLRRAESDLRTALADDSVRETHEAARYLLARILFRLKPDEAAELLAPRLLTPLGEGNRERQLRLFTELLDDAAYEGKTAALREAHDLIDWIFSFQSSDPAEVDHAVSRWKETSSVAWLAAALSKVSGDHPDVPAMLYQAVEIGAHPATPTLFYHQARVLAERGERDLARGVLDTLIPRLEAQPSARNRAAELRTELARGFRDFFEYGVQRPALVAGVFFEGRYDQPWDQDGWFGWSPQQRREWLDSTRDGPRLAPAAARVLNQETPVRMLALLAGQLELAQEIRAELLAAAWTRAVALGQLALAAEVAPQLAQLQPELAQDLDAFLAAGPETKLFEAQLALLNSPGLSVTVRAEPVRGAGLRESDPRGLNWWAPPYEAAPPVGELDFLNASQRRQAADEWKSIHNLGRPYEWILAAAETEAQKPRPHPRTAEALYRLATVYEGVDLRWGYDMRPPPEAQRAAQLLEFRFSRSEWAKRLATERRNR